MRRKYTDQEFIEAVKNSFSIRTVLNLLNLKPTGGNYDTFYNKVKILNLDTSHFTGQGHSIPHPAWNKKSDEEIFHENSTRRLSPRERKRLLDKKVLGENCAKCNLGSLWQNEFIKLHIDHINGNPHDNRIENLRLLCPNCHSQTETYCGLNKKKNNIKNGTVFDEAEANRKCNFKNKCIDCDKLVYRESTRCRKCNNKLNVK